MGRKLNIAQPTVIDTVLSPLTESFYIEENGQLQQWYYNIDGSYKPNRKVTPLILTPHIGVYDPETEQSYTPLIVQPTTWSRLVNGSWVAIDVTEATAQASDDYVMRSDFSLIVRKNVDNNSPVTLKCSLVYQDPRLPGQTYTSDKTVTLTTNVDTSIMHPTIRIVNPPLRTFDVLTGSVYDSTAKMYKGLMSFTATATKGTTDKTSETYFVWYIRESKVVVQNNTETVVNTEVLAQNHPCYVSGQNTATLTVDMMYAERVVAVCRAKASSTASTLYPDQAVATIDWQESKMDAFTTCENGTTVNSVARNLFFKPLVNIKGHQLTDSEKKAHLRFHWKRRKANLSAVTDCGYGPNLVLSSTQVLDYAKVGTQVFADVLLRGPYEAVTYNGQAVTYNSQTVFARS